MKITLLEIAYYNKRKECVQEFFNGRYEDKLEDLLYEVQVLYNLKKLEVQSTEHKGVKKWTENSKYIMNVVET